MRPTHAVVCTVAVFLGMAAISIPTAYTEEETTAIETETDRISYVIGVQVGSSVLQGGLEVAPEPLVQGIMDTIGEKDLALSDEELQEAMMALQRKMAEAQQEMQRQMQQQQELQQQQQLQRQQEQQLQ